LLGRAGAGNLNFDGGFGQRNGRLFAGGQLRVRSQIRSISHLHFHRVFHLRFAHFESGVKFAGRVSAAALVFDRVPHVTSFAFFRLLFFARFFLAAFDGLRASAVIQERLIHGFHAIVRAFSRLCVGFHALGGSFGILAGDLHAATAVVLLHVHDLTRATLLWRRTWEALAVGFVEFRVFFGAFVTKDFFLLAAEALITFGFFVTRCLFLFRFLQNARVVGQASALVGFGDENVAFCAFWRSTTSFLFALFYRAAASLFLDSVLARIFFALGCVVDGALLSGIIAEISGELLAVGDDAAVVFAARFSLIRHVEHGLGLVAADGSALVISFGSVDQGPSWTRVFTRGNFLGCTFLVLSGF